MILAGDIGGTNTRLAFFERSSGGSFASIVEKRFASAAFSNVADVVREFLNGKAEAFEAVCFGIAAPVTSDVVKVTNLPWTIDAGELREVLRFENVRLINDLAATAYGLSELKPADFAVLNAGDGAAGNRAIIAAGTGLGEAGLFFDDKTNDFKPFATEGGHADFAPRDETEVELLRYLLTKYPHVSAERVVSGQGIENIYRFLRDRRGEREDSRLRDELAESADAAAVIVNNALDGKSELCQNALDIFAACYGAEAGNLALKTMATGGVYLGGGIAPKILAKLKQSGFMRAFKAKGRMSELLAETPVRVILNDNAALLGAAHYGFHNAGTRAN